MTECGYIVALSFIFSLVQYSTSDTYVLYNTKAATSDLDWTLHPPYQGWEELSGLDVDGNTIRSYQVCNIGQPNQDNWARTPYIDAKSAKRVHIDIEFSVMKCEECRETFTLYYYASSSNVASSTFPPWRENPFVKIDTVAAGERFESSNAGPKDINKKSLVIGPLQRSGFYIAAQDQGACMSMMSLKLYYYYCPEITYNLSYFPKTVAGGNVASLIQVEGRCVSNAVYVGNEVPKYHCNSNGEWKVPTGMCQCRAGYTPSKDRTACQACPAGFYKSKPGNQACSRCPSHSTTHTTASSRCMCNVGFYRTSVDSIDQPCTRPPSGPFNIVYDVNETSVQINWSTPAVTGSRKDLYYSVTCKQCDEGFERCQPCPASVNFEPPQRHHVTGHSIDIFDLKPFSYYVVKVTSHNGVSSVSNIPGSSQQIRFSTSESVPSAVLNLSLLKSEKRSLSVQWTAPHTSNGNILEYEVQVIEITSDGVQSALKPLTTADSVRNITVDDLKSGVSYEVKVRARTAAGFGQFSEPLVHSISQEDDPDSEKVTSEGSSGMVAGIIAGIVVLLLVVIVVVLVLHRRRRGLQSSRNRVRTKLSTEGSTAQLLGRDGLGTSVNGHTRKTYVDYRDPHKGVKEMAREIDVSRIKIERVIGRGEFGEVCKGKLMEGKGSQTVAVKRLQHGASLIDQTNFLREACTMAQFYDPNIVQLKGVVTKSMPAMILTEFVDNGSLDKFLQTKRGELSALQMIQMLKGIASGMRYLSSMKYVHRDLAARNILVDSNLNCKVTDFGLSRTLENEPHATYTTQGGKIALRWTAPECIRYRQFTSASDVWSYGIVMWEVMSYGEKPYWDMSNDDVTEVIEDGYRLPAPLDCPPALHNLMLQCWCYEPRRRPNFNEILNQLEQFIQQPSLLLSEPGMPDLSAPLLNPDSPTSLQDVSNLEEWLDMVKLGRYRRSFYAHGINDLESLAHITANDLERLGISSPTHRSRLQSGLDTLRHHLSTASGLAPGTSSTMRLSSDMSPPPTAANRSFTLPSQQQRVTRDVALV